MAEKLADVPDGQGNPPEVVTGTGWLVNVADELALLQVPEIVAEPAADGVAVALQVWPKTLAVHWTPPTGMVRLAAPLEDAHKFQVPLVVQVAEKVIPQLTVHPVRVGAGLIVPQIGAPEPEDAALKFATDELQATVHVPSLMVTLDDDAVVAPVGETASADAAWAPRPSTAATKPRVMRICVAFITATPVGVGLSADATAR